MRNSRKKAQSLIEYGLILALVAIVAISVMAKFGTQVTKSGDNAVNAMNETSSGSMNTYCNSIKGGTAGYNTSTGACN